MKKITECLFQKLKLWNSDDSSNTSKGKNNALDEQLEICRWLLWAYIFFQYINTSVLGLLFMCFTKPYFRCVGRCWHWIQDCWAFSHWEATIVHYYTTKTQCQKSKTNIPRKGNALPMSQFAHSCIYERLIYSHDRSAYSATGNMWINPENIYKSPTDTYGCGNWDWEMGVSLQCRSSTTSAISLHFFRILR